MTHQELEYWFVVICCTGLVVAFGLIAVDQITRRKGWSVNRDTDDAD